MPPSPRKVPRQERSVALVDAILAAALRLLQKSGFSRSTTNHIAELAGVSVGSLYQYFPSKDAIFAKLINRVLSDNENLLLSRLEAMQGAPLEAIVGEA